MLDFSRHQVFFRFVTITVIMAMFPMLVNAQMLIESAGAPVTRTVPSVDTPSAPANKPAIKKLAPPKLLTEAEMRETAGLPSIDEEARQQTYVHTKTQDGSRSWPACVLWEHVRSSSSA